MGNTINRNVQTSSSSSQKTEQNGAGQVQQPELTKLSNFRKISSWSLGSLSSRLNWSFRSSKLSNSFSKHRTKSLSKGSNSSVNYSKTTWPAPLTDSIFISHFKRVNKTNDYIVDHVIAEGAFGIVFKVIDKKKSNLEYALKILKKSKIIEGNSVQQIKDEVDIQKLCGHHPFIVKHFDSWQTRRHLHILLEYIPGGELFTKIRNFPYELIRLYVAEISLAIDFLHNAGVIYRDVKPENILLNRDYHIKLTDFGLSKWLKFGDRTRTICGTFQYMAPEILKGEPYGYAVDWWSIGVLACRMLTDQDNPSGTGPLRPKFEQPTMYNHIETFNCFKDMILHNQQLRIEKEKSMNRNSKFTNLKVDITKIEECCNNFSTQNVIDSQTKMQNSTDTSQIVKSLNNEGNKDETEEILEDTSQIPIINISRSPINCPVSTCKETIGVTSLLSHFVRSHKQKFPLDFQHIVGNQRAILAFDVNMLLLNENMCLGILVYGGENSMDKSKPGLKGICKPNSFLPGKYLEFVNHLPILIMACKISINTLYNINGEFLNKDDEFIIVLWLASIETTKRIDCTLTAFSFENNSSRSTIINVQDLKFVQNPLEFIPKHSDYLTLNNGEVNILTNNRQSIMQIEMFVHEF